MDASGELIANGIEKVKQDVLGMGKDVNPMEKFQLIFENSELLYKTRQLVQDKSGLGGVFGRKQLSGFEVIVDNFDNAKMNVSNPKENKSVITSTTVISTQAIITEVKCVSASQLARIYGLQAKEITAFMQQKGFVHDDAITEIGKSKGLVIKTYMGNSYIAYPENLAEIKELSRN